jgi:serine/threonine-protein kinase
MVTAEGKVKILDFGLAKAHLAESSAIDIATSPTITAQMTEPGVILGTAGYMSPEQARGRSADKRSDIWAFGCILYECLTGKRAFPGDTVSDTLAQVLKGEPDWAALPAKTPVNIKTLLRRCLQKNPKSRLHDIADARLEIEAPVAYPSEAIAARRTLSPLWLAAGAAFMFLAGVLVGRLLIRRPQSTPYVPPVTATIKVEPGYWLDGMRRALELERPSRTAMAISADGQFIVYCAIEENPGPQARSQLYLRRLDKSEAKPITGTEGGISPFLSPDGQWVGFWTDRKLKKVPAEGGVATELCGARSIFGATWGRDNSIVFSDGFTTGLSRVSAEGGKPEILTRPDPKREEASHRLPCWLPNGKAVLFSVMRNAFDTQPWLALLRLDTREWRALLQDAVDAKYLPTGHLVFLRQGKLMAVRFDLARLEVIGHPVALVDNLMQTFSTNSGLNTGAGQFGISETGSLIYAEGGVIPDMKNSLVWVDQRGIEQPVTDLQFPYFAPRLSPDGQKIAYLTAAREWQVWVYDLVRGTNSRLTDQGMAGFPIWTLDGKRLLFGWAKSLAKNLCSQPYDGSSPMERLTTSELDQDVGSWSSDGKTVALAGLHPDTRFDIDLLDAQSGRVTPFLNSQFNETYPEFSPDSRWLAYTSAESGRNEVYVRPFPAPGIKQQVSSEGGEQPLWARNGRQLFYRWQDQVWAVDVRTDGGFSTSKPRLLYEKAGYSRGSPIRSYDLCPDGQRFLMVKLEQREPTPVTEMTLVQNWFEELERLVPAGKK